MTKAVNSMLERAEMAKTEAGLDDVMDTDNGVASRLRARRIARPVGNKAGGGGGGSTPRKKRSRK